jgi:hypothetical protein
MVTILKAMLKEEWRIHATLFGNIMFAVFPLMLGVLAFMCSFALRVFETLMPVEQIALIAHYLFVFFGLSVGAFGLFGKEIMNRRFGQASLIAYSSRSLPLSERKIFLNFFVKDVLYYFCYWVLPVVLGFAAASPFLAIDPVYPALFLVTASLSFLIGIALVFFLSTIYAHSSRVLIALVLVGAALALLTAHYVTDTVLALLPSFALFMTRSPRSFASSLLLIIVPSALSLLFLKTDYPDTKRQYSNALEPLADTFTFTQYNYFIAKDFLDLSRSEGGLGKLIFSFFFPLALIGLLLAFSLEFIPALHFLPLFALFLGLFSTAIYSWMTEFDLFYSYSFLPLRVSDVLKSKLLGFALINLLSILVILLVGWWQGELVYLAPSVLVFIAVSSFAVSITVYLGGLTPNILLYNPKTLLLYLIAIGTTLFLFLILAILNPFYLLTAPALIPVSWYVLKISYAKWDRIEQSSF